MTAFTQIGSDINGETAGDNIGQRISLSGDGTIVATGTWIKINGMAIDGNFPGFVRVFQWNGSSWNQLGDDIDGEAAGDRSGYYVSLSADGTILAIGAPENDGNSGDTNHNSGHTRIYQWDGSAWNQLGDDIDGEDEGDRSGHAISLSNDGNTVAIGAYEHDGTKGHTRIYDWDGNVWVQRGTDIDGEAAVDASGRSVSLSGDGNTVAIGASHNDGDSGDPYYNSGHTRIYDWNGTDWVQRGSDIDGEASGDLSSYPGLALSSDGNTVAIGSTLNDSNGNISAGHTRIYDWNGTEWVQRGSDIDGTIFHEEFGWDVSLSSDGNTVAIGAKFPGDDSGHTRIYAWNGTAWNQIDTDFDVEGGGGSVSLSNDGTIFATNAAGQGDSGQVRVFKISDTTAPTFASAATNADGTKVVLTYNEALSATTAATTDFAVTTDGAANAVTAVAVSGSTVELTLTDTVKNDQTVTVAYTDPSGANDNNAVQDSAGNDVASLSSTSVTNNSTVVETPMAVTNNSSVDGTPPTFASAATNADGTKVVLTYNEALSATTAATTDFAVTTDGAANAVIAVAVSGSTVELTLTNTVKNDQTVNVAYTDPSNANDNNSVQDSQGNDVASLSSTAVTNNSTVAGTPPTFASAATNADGTKVVLTYNEALSATTAATTDFAVTTDGAANAVIAVAVSGSTVELTLTNTVKNDQTVNVAYTDPSGANDNNAVQDSAGNDVASLSSTSVTNNSTVSDDSDIAVDEISKIWTFSNDYLEEQIGDDLNGNGVIGDGTPSNAAAPSNLSSSSFSNSDVYHVDSTLSSFQALNKVKSFFSAFNKIKGISTDDSIVYTYANLSDTAENLLSIIETDLGSVTETLTVIDPADDPTSLATLKSIKSHFSGNKFVYNGIKGTSKELAESREDSFDWIANITSTAGAKQAIITDLGLNNSHIESITSGLGESDYLFTVTGVKGNASPFIAVPSKDSQTLDYQSNINFGASINYTTLPDKLSSGNYTTTAVGFANNESPTRGNLDDFNIAKVDITDSIRLNINFYGGEQLSHINISGADLSASANYSYSQTAGKETSSIDDDIWTLALTVEPGKPAKTASVADNAGIKVLGVMVNALSADRVGSPDDYGGSIFRTNAWWNDITLLSEEYKFSEVSPGFRIDGTDNEEVDFDFYFSKNYLERTFDVDFDAIPGGFSGTGLSSVNTDNDPTGTYIDISKPGAISALRLPVEITNASETKADGDTDFYRVSFTNNSWSQANVSLAYGPSFRYKKTKKAVLRKGCRDDIIHGSSKREIFYGDCGADTIVGRAGRDKLLGGKGSDSLKGNTGRDLLRGGRKHDTIHGGPGQDTLKGGKGKDLLKGKAGLDFLRGGRNDDLLRGGRKHDTIHGGPGQDTLNGGKGKDLLQGKAGRDFIRGGRNDDLLRGGRKQDSIHGGPGQDTLKGGKGKDLLKGKAGRDFIRGGRNDDLLRGGRKQDTIHGGPGQDTIFGGPGQDILNGGPEADQFMLSSGEDIIQDFTISDNDTIKYANYESIRLIQSGRDLLLTTQSGSISTVLTNINRDDLIQSQPDLDWL